MKEPLSTWGATFEMDRIRNCSRDCCRDAVVASLGQQDLCLEHFLSDCYRHLERVDMRGRGLELAAIDLALTKAFVEECSRQALDVSLRCPKINNLQRGRLLDILLWAGDLFILLRAPGTPFTAVTGVQIPSGTPTLSTTCKFPPEFGRSVTVR
jgi:hypothetical protein